MTRRLVPIALVTAACSRPIPVDATRLASARRVAIVSRLERGPSVRFARVDAAAAALVSGARDAAAADDQIAAALARRMGRFELTERLRGELVRRLPERPPFTDVVPPADVATALETLLVDTGGEPPDFDSLRQLRADVALDVAIHDYGVVRREGKTGLYGRVTAHLFTLSGRATLYRRSLEIDDLRDGRTDLDAAGLVRGEGGWRDALLDAVGRIAQAIAVDLGGADRTAPAPAAPKPAPSAPDAEEEAP